MGLVLFGSHAIFLGAFDPRVKVVVAQVPGLDVVGTLIAIAGREGFLGFLGPLADDHVRRNAGAPSAPFPVVAPDGQPSVLATPDWYEWFTASRSYARTGSITRPSRAWHAPRSTRRARSSTSVAPKPLLIVAAVRDSLVPIDLVRSTFARAGEPKELVELDCGHFEVYPGGTHHEVAADAATEWFTAHLA